MAIKRVPSLREQARNVAAAGRSANGVKDTRILHVNPQEASAVDVLLKSMGGSGTENPRTGAMEYRGGRGGEGGGNRGGGSSGGGSGGSGGGGGNGGGGGGSTGGKNGTSPGGAKGTGNTGPGDSSKGAGGDRPGRGNEASGRGGTGPSGKSGGGGTGGTNSTSPAGANIEGAGPRGVARDPGLGSISGAELDHTGTTSSRRAGDDTAPSLNDLSRGLLGAGIRGVKAPSSGTISGTDVDAATGGANQMGAGPRGTKAPAKGTISGAELDRDVDDDSVSGFLDRFWDHLMNPTEDPTFNIGLAGWKLGIPFAGLVSAGVAAAQAAGISQTDPTDNNKSSGADPRQAAAAADDGTGDDDDGVPDINQNYSDARLQDRRAAGGSGNGGTFGDANGPTSAADLLVSPMSRYVPRRRLIGLGI